MTIVLGLTGSIGMGKSTTAGFFRDAGIPVWDADQCVHRLYAPGGAAVEPLAALCPAALREGGIDRAALKDWIAADPDALHRIEAVVHPLVARDRAEFLQAHRRAQAPLVVLDVPLLFESGADRLCDATLVVTAPPEIQRARVLDRPGMDSKQFESMLARQMPDEEKRRRADHVIETLTPDQARDAVHRLIARLTGGKHA